MFGSKFDYLRLSEKTIQEIQHDEMYVREGLEMTGYRRIYQNVEYDYYEKKQISKFKEILHHLNISLLGDDVLLRFLYAGYFNETNSLELYKRYLAWINTANLTFLPDQVLHYLKEGLVYIGGKDYQFRPIIVINLHLLNFYLFDSDSFLHALQTLLIVCEDYLFFPGKVENIVVIIEANQASIFQFPQKSFQVIIWTLSQNFPQILDRLYIFNPTKEIIKTWDFYSNYIDSRTLKKIEMWESKSFAPLAHGFHPDMFEKKFGGGLEDMTQFWLPLQILKQPSSINYKIQKPDYSGGTIQYSLYNDPQELLKRLEERDKLEQEQQQQEASQKISTKKSVQNIKQPIIDYHQTMGDMFNLNQQQQSKYQQQQQQQYQQQQIFDDSQDLSMDFRENLKQNGFQGKSAIEQGFRSEAVLPESTIKKEIGDNKSVGSYKNAQYSQPASFGKNLHSQTYQPNNYQPLQTQQQRSQTVGNNQIGAPAQGERIMDSFDAKLLNDSQNPNRASNVQACVVM